MENFDFCSVDFTDVLRDAFWACQVYLEAVVQRCSVKKVFLQISQNSQEKSTESLTYT